MIGVGPPNPGFISCKKFASVLEKVLSVRLDQLLSVLA